MSVPAIPQSLVVDAFDSKNVRLRTARLIPKEHGAYAILGVPLAAALAITGATPLTLLIAIAAVTGFLLHEPLLIIAGRRGSRAQEATPAAIRAIVRRLAVVAACGSSAVLLSGTTARYVLVACLLVAAIELSASISGFSRTLWAQLLGTGSLTLPSAAVLTAGGVSLNAAVQFWLIWVAGRVATMTSVRSMIVRSKSQSLTAALVIYDVLLGITIAACGVGVLTERLLWVTMAPMLIAALVLRMATPHPRYLKRIGWMLLAVNAISGLLMVELWNL